MSHRRRLHRRFRGRHPALRWRVQHAALRARGVKDEFSVPHHHVWADTQDGVRLAGSVLGANPDVAVVLVHGFMGYRTKPRWRTLAEGLATRFTVFAFDLRGHGQSGGACTGGEREMLDVEAAVAFARARGFRRVVTVGGSLGGIAVISHAAHFRTSDAVVAISTPAGWETNGSRAVRRAQWLFTSPLGRSLARRLMGTRIHLDWGDPKPPAEVIGDVAPTPVLIVHGDDDHFFPASDAQLLYQRAHEPKRLMLIAGFGHAEDGFTPAFAARLAADIGELLPAAEAR